MTHTNRLGTAKAELLHVDFVDFPPRSKKCTEMIGATEKGKTGLVDKVIANRREGIVRHPKPNNSPIQDIEHPLFSLKRIGNEGLEYELTIKDRFSAFMAMNLAGMIYDLTKQNPTLTLKIGMLSEVKKIQAPSLIIQ